MGLFDFFKKPKNDIEQYLDEMKKREQTTTMGKKITNDISSGVDASLSNHYNKRIEENTLYSETAFLLHIQDAFMITGRGVVVTGRISSGKIRIGEIVTLKHTNNLSQEVKVVGIEIFRKCLDEAVAGDNVGLLLEGVTRKDILVGDTLIKA